jgi:transposase-like protein
MVYGIDPREMTMCHCPECGWWTPRDEAKSADPDEHRWTCGRCGYRFYYSV